MKPVEEWLHKNLKNLNHPTFKNVVKIHEDDTKPMDDGQIVIISDINRVKLTLETSDGDKRTLTAIAKFEPATSGGLQLAQQCDVFDNEIWMYKEVLKSMEKLMSEVNDKELLWPECYHCADKKLLLEDLCEVGYRVVPTYKFLDLDHVLLTMKAIGKFHALSMVMKERKLLDLSKLGPIYFSRKIPFLVNIHKSTALGISHHIKENWGPEWSSIPEKLMKLAENPSETMAHITESVKGVWEVLVHADFSIRNMLFHYPPNSDKPDGIKFVDFQMTTYSCMGYDFTSLLYTSILPRLREDNMHTILQTYIDSLSSTCHRYNYNGSIPSTKDVKDVLNSLSYLTTMFSLSSYPFFIASGKMNLQDKVDKGMDMFTSENPGQLEEMDMTEEYANYFNNEEVEQVLKYEIDRCLKKNLL